MSRLCANYTGPGGHPARLGPECRDQPVTLCKNRAATHPVPNDSQTIVGERAGRVRRKTLSNDRGAFARANATCDIDSPSPPPGNYGDACSLASRTCGNTGAAFDTVSIVTPVHTVQNKGPPAPQLSYAKAVMNARQKGGGTQGRSSEHSGMRNFKDITDDLTSEANDQDFSDTPPSGSSFDGGAPSRPLERQNAQKRSFDTTDVFLAPKFKGRNAFFDAIEYRNDRTLPARSSSGECKDPNSALCDAIRNSPYGGIRV